MTTSVGGPFNKMILTRGIGALPYYTCISISVTNIFYLNADLFTSSKAATHTKYLKEIHSKSNKLWTSSWTEHDKVHCSCWWAERRHEVDQWLERRLMMMVRICPIRLHHPHDFLPTSEGIWHRLHVWQNLCDEYKWCHQNNWQCRLGLSL